MLSLVVSDAARGVNIAERYPDFYRHLLADPELQQQFRDSLDLLLRTRSNSLEPLPGSASQDLCFLQTRPRPELSLIPTNVDGWIMSLKLNTNHLNSLFFPTQPNRPTRYGLSMGLDEDNWFTLFREMIRTETDSWDVVLEGTPVDEPVNSLKLAFVIIPVAEGVKEWPRLQATLSWGRCEETILIDKNGRATFPLVELASVLDETRQRMRDDLILVLTAQ